MTNGCLNKKQPLAGMFPTLFPRLVTQPRHHPVTVRRTGFCNAIIYYKQALVNRKF